MAEETPIPRDFYARDPEDQKLLLQETWCDHCQQVGLGMTEPVEYELFGIIFIEGKCCQCGETVMTELTDDDF
ncbi:MAG: hypothetical protein CMI01_00505 [Oceanospirillaceae bacterium]|uniref:hypothetical protein n=1 Tax=Marinobacterium litorale TaxID=404770 RepID=UPI0004180287|nr:hypothetical protein [Marinobacterium litorale]MBS97147.1 hypothetical protein [Oceanospirillaceae bacterium]